MMTEIGIAAGEIWNHLELKGRAGMDDLLSVYPKNERVALMALGWLAREGHVLFSREHEVYFISLNKR